MSTDSNFCPDQWRGDFKRWAIYKKKKKLIQENVVHHGTGPDHLYTNYQVSLVVKMILFLVFRVT